MDGSTKNCDDGFLRKMKKMVKIKSMYFVGTVQLTFIILKLSGEIGWNWALVFFPMEINFVINLLQIIVAVIRSLLNK